MKSLLSALAAASAAFAIAACGTPTITSSRATPSPSDASTTSSATSTPTPSATPSPNTPCRLPVAVQVGGSANYEGGFITYPGGDYSRDSSADINYDSASRLYVTITKPVLRGVGAPTTYSHARQRWLPATIEQLSPDSTHYAYAYFPGSQPWKATSEVHVVDISTGADHVVYHSGSYLVLDYESDGIYLTSGHYGSEGYNGLWLLSADGTKIRQLESKGFWYRVGGGAAWSGDVPAGDHAVSGPNPMDRVLRRDLKSGTVEPWFHENGVNVSVIGFDASGSPLILTTGESSTWELWLVPNPASAHKIAGGSTSSPLPVAAFSDSIGTWLSSGQGRVWLYNGGASLDVVSTAGSAYVAGRCEA